MQLIFKKVNIATSIFQSADIPATNNTTNIPSYHSDSPLDGDIEDINGESE
jgi:hypothetical protein